MKRLKKTLRVFLYFLVSVIGVLGLLFLFINLPFSDRFVSTQVNRLFTSIDLPLHIESIRKVLPTKVTVEGVTITGVEGDTIIRVMDLDTHISLPALLHKKVKLKQTYLGGILVHLSNDSTNSGINIARTFSKKDKVKKERSEEEKDFWEISINGADLQNVDFQMTDPASGLHIHEELNALKMTGFNISLYKKSIDFKTINLKTSRGGIKISPRLFGPKEKKGGPWSFGFRKVQLSDLDFTFNQQTDSLLMNLSIQEGSIRTNVTDFSNKKIDANQITLKGADATILTGLASKSSSSSSTPISSSFSWDLIFDDIDLEDVNVFQGQYSYPLTPDLSSLSSLSELNTHLVDISLNSSSAGVKVKSLAFNLGNGFSLQKMKGEFASNPETTQLDFNISTENSQIKLEGGADASIFSMPEKAADIRNAQLSFENTSLSLKDILFFKQNLQEIPTFSTLAQAPISIEGDMGLDKQRINLRDLLISQEDHFSISLEGYAEDAFQPKEARGDLKFELSALNSAWWNKILEELDQETDHAVLTSLSIQGSISDSLKYSGLNLALKSNLGDVELSGTFDLNKKSFDLNSTFEKLLPGTLLKIESLGEISGKGAFSGSGFMQDSLSLGISLLLDSLTYKNYQYRSASITGTMDSGLYEFNLLVDDPNLKTGLYTTIDHRDSTWILNTNGKLFAQLDELHFSGDTSSVESTITAFFSKTPGAIESEIILLETEFLTSTEEANIQELNASFASDSNQVHIQAEADFLTTDIYISDSIVHFDTFVKSYRNYLSTFVDSSHTSADTRIAELPTTNITGSITYHDAIGMLLQDSGIHFGNLDFSLTNSASDQSLKYILKGKDLKYKSIEIGDLKSSAIDSAGIMDVQLFTRQNTLFENPAYNISLNGHFANWESKAEFSVNDDSGKIIYNIELASSLDSNNFILTNPKQQIVLNSQQWMMESPTLLSVNLDNKQVYPRLRMQSDSSEIHFYSGEENGQHEYYCELDHVFLESLFRTTLLPGHPSGILSGQVSYGTNENTERNINTDLQFNNIEWNEVSFGMIAVKGYLNSDTAGTYAIDMLTRVDSSTIALKYNQNADESRSLSTEFTSMPLSFIQPFVVKHLSEMDGYMSGNIDLSNEGDGGVDGLLNFRGASMRIKAINSKYSLPDERIQFSGNRLVFDEFHVLDSLNNTLDINGFIELDNEWKVYTNLDIGSSGLQVMNTSGDEKESFYGEIYLDSRISIIGPVKKPVIKGKLLLAEGSEINYRYMEDLSLSESAKFVNFVNTSPDEIPTSHFSTKQSKLFESSIETTLKIDPTTRINFSVSKWAFDIDLGISGGGDLSFQMLNNNQYSLSGRYLINKGDANLKLIGWPNKAFRIAEGGFIGWDGRIDNPNLKFEASNRVASSYTNPVDGKVRNVDIDVFLKLSNQLSDLDIEFTIFTTDQYLMSIISTLSPEEQMRQAITILLFETIDLPGISTSSNYMTQQVNQLVAAQLNSLTKTTISGIDISFGVNTYVEATEGGGEETKTSLSYDVRKTFADERAQMRVSGRMNDLNTQTGASNISLNNISLEYQLDTAASRYLKVYNERSYEDVFEGEVVKTGVGITFRKRYWNLKEIWRRKKKKE